VLYYWFQLVQMQIVQPAKRTAVTESKNGWPQTAGPVAQSDRSSVASHRDTACQTHRLPTAFPPNRKEIAHRCERRPCNAKVLRRCIRYDLHKPQRLHATPEGRSLTQKRTVVFARIAGIACLLLAWQSPTFAQGLVLPAIGPVNQSMGGASVAAPLDSIGALYWNPATLSGLPQSEMEFGVQLLYTRTGLASTLGAGSLGPGLPATALGGSSSSDTGIYPLPSFGLSYRPAESPFTYGLGVFTIGGYGVNYPGDSSNPILSARPPQGFGVGSIDSELAILELAPAVAYQVSDRLVVGITVGDPVLDRGRRAHRHRPCFGLWPCVPTLSEQYG
jgi:hypothetical protein